MTIDGGQSTDHFSTNGPSCPSVGWVRDLSRSYFLPRIFIHRLHPSTGHRFTHESLIPPYFGAAWDSLDIEFGFFLKVSSMALGDNFLDVFNPNTIVYEINISHITFIQNKHVKLNETCLDTQGHFKAHLSNIMNVLGRLTSKLHETQHTAYTCYNNSFKDLKTS